MSQKRVGILDYGVGNVASLKGAIERTGHRVVVGESKLQLDEIDILFLPGVGSFDFALNYLIANDLQDYISDCFWSERIPIVGICLGMQLMFESSEEGVRPGLGLIKGEVRRFDNNECHVGWNYVYSKSIASILEAYPVYFNHSYKVICDDSVSLGGSEYQGRFTSMVRSRRFTGLQFHPEKSQVVGRKILKYLVDEA